MLVFFASATVLPSFAAVGAASTPVYGGDGMFISQDAEDIDALANDFEAAYVNEDGVLSNLAFGSGNDGRSSGNSVTEYTVREGDSLGAIAVRYGVSSSTIQRVNNLSSTMIKPGQILKILPVDGTLFTVSAPTSIEDIAKKYAVDPVVIAEQNGLDLAAALTTGMQIVVPGVTGVKVIADSTLSPAVTTPSISKPQSTTEAKVTQSKKTTVKATTKKTPPATSETKQGKSLRWPTASPVITQKYHAGHAAIDICYTKGDHTTAIVAAAGGKVIKAQGGYNGGYGNMIIIDHGNGLRTLYAHMRELYVTPGQEVTAGQTIGWMGNTGRSYGRTGLHLHFEVIQGKAKLNPLSFL